MNEKNNICIIKLIIKFRIKRLHKELINSPINNYIVVNKNLQYQIRSNAFSRNSIKESNPLSED